MTASVLSLLVCTRDRSARIQRCLESLPAEAIARLGIEVVVVDNASGDDTPNVLRTLATTLPFPLRHLREERPGKSHALNTGLELCTGEFVVFTDDDCVLAPDYFDSLTHELADGAIDYASGRILRYDERHSDISTNTSTRRRLFPPRSFLPTGSFQGGNMVFRRRIFGDVGGFDPLLGPSTRYRCEDIEMAARASMAGYTGAFLPSLVVYHDFGHMAGSLAERQKRANAFAHGAYYLRFISQGNLCYLWGWLVNSMRCWRVDHTLFELWGAWDYWRNPDRPRR